MSSIRPLRAKSSTLLTSLTAAAALQLVACGPIVFEDASALNVIGAPPTTKAAVVAEPPGRVAVQDDRLVISEKIQFDFNEATIKPESSSLMQEITAVIKQNPHIKRLAIEGHTSSEGTDKYNLWLSDRRAKAVMEYLVERGDLPQEMFTARGLGESKPIAEESTPEGREKNRRVEFSIIEQDPTRKTAASAAGTVH